MLGTRQLPFPAQSFDLVHCSRCLIPYTAYSELSVLLCCPHPSLSLSSEKILIRFPSCIADGTYFVEVDRVLRPGGYFVISGPPVQWPKQDKEWVDLQSLASALCYELIVVDGNTVIWKKPSAGSCFPKQNEFGLDQCSDSDNPSYAW